MTSDFIARAEVCVAAPPDRVWQALIDPAAMAEYMFGATVESTWKEGAPITWTGEWQGKPYRDHGTVLKAMPPETLQYTHVSGSAAGSGQPEQAHTVTITLRPTPDGTEVRLTQDKNPTDEARAHSESNWRQMLAALKGYVEARTSASAGGR